jgi:hypothetical protein
MGHNGSSWDILLGIIQYTTNNIIPLRLPLRINGIFDVRLKLYI